MTVLADAFVRSDVDIVVVSVLIIVDVNGVIIDVDPDFAVSVSGRFKLIMNGTTMATTNNPVITLPAMIAATRRLLFLHFDSSELHHHTF